MADMIELARQYGRYGYRRIAALLREAGWQVNDKRIERLWRLEGLKVPTKQPGRGRLWLNDGSCVRLRAERPNHVWSYDFVHHRTHDAAGVPDAQYPGRAHARVPGDPCSPQALFYRCHRRPDGPVHHAWPARLHQVRQWARVRR